MLSDRKFDELFYLRICHGAELKAEVPHPPTDGIRYPLTPSRTIRVLPTHNSALYVPMDESK